METPSPKARVIGLDLGNLADVNYVAINPAHITHVRLSGTERLESRKLEIYLVSGVTVTMNFDESAKADAKFDELAAAIEYSRPPSG